MKDEKQSTLFCNSNEQPVDLTQLYRGATAFLVLNGPSLKQVDLSKLKHSGALSVGINNGPRAFQPNLWISSDRPRKFLPSIWLNPQILKFVRKRHFNQKIWDIENNCDSDRLVRDCPGIFWFQVNRKYNKDTFLSRPFAQLGPPRAKSTMIAAIRILHELGIQKIYLLGCDFKMDREEPYFFKERVTEASFRHNNKAYKRLAEIFAELQPQLQEAGLEIYNCNPDSNLKVFPFRDYETVLAQLKNNYQGLQESEREVNFYAKS